MIRTKISIYCTLLPTAGTVTFGAGPGDGYNRAFTDAAAVLAAWHPGEEGAQFSVTCMQC